MSDGPLKVGGERRFTLVCSWTISSIKHNHLVVQGGGKELSGRHDAGGGVFRVTQKTVSFTIVLLGGHLQDLTN